MASDEDEDQRTGGAAAVGLAVALAVETRRPAPGLYLVATPIGAARDITLRALDILNTADLLAAEDTRTLRHLMAIHGIALRGRRVLAYHDHNETTGAAAPILAALAEGAVVAYASDAGTPLVSDPGFRLAREAIAAGMAVHAAPGPSAVLAALTVSGLPSDRFMFAGFAPHAEGARRRWLEQLLGVDATVIVFENPRRVKQLLGELCEKEPDRATVVCRELTKRFEEVIRGTAVQVRDDPRMDGIRGEVVVLIDRAGVQVASEDDARAMLAQLMAGGASSRDAARQVAAVTGLARRDVYRMAIEGDGE